MTRWVIPLVLTTLLTATAAHAESPLDAFTRLLDDAGSTLFGPPPPTRAKSVAQPPQVIAHAPIPTLRPGEPPTSAPPFNPLTAPEGGPDPEPAKPVVATATPAKPAPASPTATVPATPAPAPALGFAAAPPATAPAQPSPTGIVVAKADPKAVVPAPSAPAPTVTAPAVAAPPVQTAPVVAAPTTPGPATVVKTDPPTTVVAPVDTAGLGTGDFAIPVPPYHPRPAQIPAPPPTVVAAIGPVTPPPATAAPAATAKGPATPAIVQAAVAAGGTKPSVPTEATTSCAIALAAFGVKAQPAVAFMEGGCRVSAPVNLSAAGDIVLMPKALIDCATAATLSSWLQETVAPKAQAMLGGKLTAIRVLDSYDCRTVDDLPGGNLSEHSRGKAIDVGAFKVGDRWITVGAKDVTQSEQTFLDSVRKSACGPFTTVLGPGSDQYHYNHFHLDQQERQTAGPSKGLYCT